MGMLRKFAFIHGAGDVGWYWHLVEAELRARGHDTVAPDLPVDDDNAGLCEYADIVIEAIGMAGDVVVVAQSFGAYVAPMVAERVHARLIVLVAGMVPAPHESAETMFEITGWQPEQLADNSARSVFYHDVPAVRQVLEVLQGEFALEKDGAPKTLLTFPTAYMQNDNTNVQRASAWPVRQGYKLKKPVDPGFLEFSSRKPREELTASKRSD